MVVVAGLVFYWYRVTRHPPIPYIKWTKSFGVEQFFSTSPVVGHDGSLYLVSVRGTVHSLSPSGAIRWEYHLNLDEFIAGGLLQDQDENIYFTSLTGVHSLTSSGHKRWEIACSPARMWQDDQGTAFDGNVLYTECGNSFCALNKDDGSRLWSESALDWQSAPVVLKNGVVVFITGRQLLAVNRDGKTVWVFPRDSVLAYDPRLASNSPPGTWETWVDTPIAVGSDETLYVGSAGNHKFLALDANGGLKWKFDVGIHSFRTSPVIASDGTVLAVTLEDLVYALAPDGTMKWNFQLPKSTNGDLHAAPVLGSDGTIYLLAEQDLIALSLEGRMLWELSLPGSFGGSPALASDGTLYVATLQGTVYAVQTASHGLMRSAWPRYQHDSSNSGRALGAGNK
jgi:outer membrane protein assembly factor BamB